MKLRTKLSLADCQSRLGSSTDLRGLALSWDSDPGAVMGEFRGTAFRLHTRKYYQNPFAPFFYGNLTEADGGVVLEGIFRMNPLVRLLTLFWLVFLLMFGVGAMMIPAPMNPVRNINRGWLFGVLAVLAVFGAASVQLGQWLARGEQSVMHSFLKDKLEASDE
ncbi:MAG TPA: hypothetical protein VGO59_03870 [Verrucomicrobiae bacterium]|jgi:hypothetical protein